MQMRASLVALLLLSTATFGASKLVWESLYAPPYSDIPGQLFVTLSCINKTLCYIPTVSNGIGPQIFAFDGQPNGKWSLIPLEGMMLLMLSITMGSSANGIHGTVGGPEILDTVNGAEYYDQASNSFKKSTLPFHLVSIVPSFDSINGGMTVLGSDDGTTNGIYYSLDGGATFAYKPVSGIPTEGNCSQPNFVKLLGPQEWYLTTAAEPPQKKNHSNIKNGIHRHKATATTFVDVHAPSLHYRFSRRSGAELRQHRQEVIERLQRLKADTKCNFYAGAIAHTTDGGNTYKTLFNNNASFAFEEIACYDSQTCVAIGFNKESTFVYATNDGTNFKRVLTLQSTSELVETVSTVKFRSKTEVWLGGGIETQSSINGLFYFSHDGGMTWVKYPVPEPNVGEVLEMSFTPDGDGFAVALTEYQQSTVLRYAVQPYYGYFTQVQCLLEGCLLCQNATFPQGMCIPAQGGSIEAFCGPDALHIRQYETTSCVGSYTNSTAPINQCLKDTQGQYFENVCGPSAASKVQGPIRHVRLPKKY